MVFNVSWICRDILSLILDISYLYFLSLFFSALLEVYQLTDFFSKNQLLFHWFFSTFLFSISLIFILCYYISYFFQFLYSSFSSFLRWELRLLIWGFLHFKCKHLVIKKIAFLALVVPHKFWCVILSFSFSPMYFAFFLRFPLSWLSSYLEVSCLIFMCWDFPIVLFFFFFFVIDFLLDSIMVRNILWMISIVLNLLRFVF